MTFRLKRAFYIPAKMCTVCICALSLAFCMTFPQLAWADVRKADSVAGESVESRNLTVAECPSIEAEYAALVDSEGNVYFSRQGDSACQIASITKVMTAIVALENADKSEKILVSEDAASIGESSANLQANDELSFDAALKALLVPSGNDAALALAESVGKHLIDEGKTSESDAVLAFVEAMNNKASELGLEDTLYENPHGLDDGIYIGNLHSTALDQAKVAKCAMEFSEIRDIVSNGSTTIEVKRDNQNVTIELETTDQLLDLYDYAIGIKTGSTDAAGPSFMGAANKEGRELYAVVLDSSDESQRFSDAKALFEWYYSHITSFSLAQSDTYTTMATSDGESKYVPVVAEVSHGDWIDKTIKATLADPDAEISLFDLEGNVTQTLTFDDVRGTVNVGDKIGTITYRQHNQVVAEQTLVAAEKVEGPNPLEAIVIMWQRFIGSFSGAASQAESQILNVMPIIDNNKTSSA